MILKYKVASLADGRAEEIAKKLNTFNGIEVINEGRQLTIEIDMHVSKQSIFDLGTLVAVMDRV